MRKFGRTHAVLEVLTIAVIVDQKIRDPELNEFKRQAVGLSHLCEAPLTESGAEAWFIENQPKILAKMEGRGRNTVVLKALTNVKDPVMRENLYDAMIAVSVSDKEYHKQESDLVRSAAAIWGFVRPPFKVADV